MLNGLVLKEPAGTASHFHVLHFLCATVNSDAKHLVLLRKYEHSIYLYMGIFSTASQVNAFVSVLEKLIVA
jgi:hypothetical protein